MIPQADLGATLLASWRTNSRITAYLVEHLPAALLDASVPGAPRRTVRMIAGHLHNARCMWIKTLGQEHGIAIPASVDRRNVARHELLSALKRSSRGIEALLALGMAAGGHVPPTKAYVWRNLPLDVPHVLTYFVAHEGHHRGQIVMLARQLGHRLPDDISAGLWQWTKRGEEARGAAVSLNLDLNLGTLEPYISRRAEGIGSRAARIAGNKPPTSPINSEYTRPIVSSCGVTRNANAT